ncbi:MAG: APC family permease [Candidatus Palauibacterales bacterium]|nr:APC family permease [Candidatus Palauibacterales bacterium]
MTSPDTKLGFQATWSMAVGGMVGGGIFSTLGVVIGISGRLAWFSFVAAGSIALLAGYSYTRLAKRYGEGGGAFTFLREIHHEGFAGSLAWVLIFGYVLTNSVYAFTFGEYLNHVLPLGPAGARVAAVAILLVFLGVNLLGTGEAGGVEIFLVWFKLAVLLGLAAFGLSRWDPPLLSRGVPDAGIGTAMIGAASVFMAYEGFQLLTYDYDDIRNPDRTLPRAILSAIVVVIAVYAAVALGTAMLIGADTVVEYQEVALSIAGQEVLGSVGVAIVTVAAAFSTGSAINATLFATARLSEEVASAGELPAGLEHRNRRRVPDRALVSLALLAALFAAVGSLSSLVESASLAFLFTFAVVSAIAFTQRAGSRLLTAAGALGAGAATFAVVVRLARGAPLALGLFTLIVLVAVFGRPVLLRRLAGRDAANRD